jgi:hypothetical protein
VKIMIGVLLAAVALGTVDAGSARAADDPDDIYAQCFDADGNDWFVPPGLVDTFDWSSCVPLAVLLPGPPPTDGQNVDAGDPDPPVETGGGGEGGAGADPKIAPDPDLYATEVRCPDGSIWAVAKGDDFVCPAG